MGREPKLLPISRYYAPNAPSIACIAPITKPASDPASQAAIPATSLGRPCRLMAMKLCSSSFIGPFSGFASVSIGPGCSAPCFLRQSFCWHCRRYFHAPPCSQVSMAEQLGNAVLRLELGSRARLRSSSEEGYGGNRHACSPSPSGAFSHHCAPNRRASPCPIRAICR